MPPRSSAHTCLFHFSRLELAANALHEHDDDGSEHEHAHPGTGKADRQILNKVDGRAQTAHEGVTHTVAEGLGRGLRAGELVNLAEGNGDGGIIHQLLWLLLEL